MQELSHILTEYIMPISFTAGIILGMPIGWFAKGYQQLRKIKGDKDGKGEVVAILTSGLVVILWALAHINNIFFEGAEVNWVLNVIGGLAVSSLIQEKDSFIKIVSAIRGNSK